MVFEQVMANQDLVAKPEKQDLQGFVPSDLPMSPVAAKEMMEQYQQLMAAILVPWDQRVFKDGRLIKDSDYQRYRIQVTDEKGNKVWVEIDYQQNLRRSRSVRY